jgi:PadR family transcriptional regulator PadR
MVSGRTDRLDGQLLKGLLDTLVLNVLAKGDNYGFGILQTVGDQLGDGTLLKDATLYPLLHRLEAKDFVEFYFQPGQRGTPRKYYRITAAGRVQLRERVSEWQRVAAILDKTIFKR